MPAFQLSLPPLLPSGFHNRGARPGHLRRYSLMTLVTQMIGNWPDMAGSSELRRDGRESPERPGERRAYHFLMIRVSVATVCSA